MCLRSCLEDSDVLESRDTSTRWESQRRESRENEDSVLRALPSGCPFSLRVLFSVLELRPSLSLSCLRPVSCFECDAQHTMDRTGLGPAG